MTARADEFLGDAQRIHKATADRLHVECRAIVADAEFRLQQRRGARKDVVGRRCRDDDQIDLVGLHSGGIDGTNAASWRDPTR